MESRLHVGAILKRLGGCGKFQISLAVLSHLLKLPTVFSMYLMIFSIAVPDWQCNDILDQGTFKNTTALPVISHTIVYSYNNISLEDYIRKNDIEATTIDVSNTITTNDECKNRNGTQCEEFLYSEELNTIVSEWSMVCSLSWAPSLIASIQMSGLFFGNMISGQLADSFGRKVPLFGSLVLLIVANLIGYFSNGWLIFGIARTLCGVAMGTFLTVQYSLSTEVTSSKWRAWITGIPSWPIGACLFSFISYLMPNWRNLHILTVLVTVPCLLLWRVIPESFRWYMSHDRKKDAHKVIKYIAKVNNMPLTGDDLKTMLHVTSDGDYDQRDQKKYSFLHLLKTRRLVKITLLSALNWFNLGLISYGLQFGLQALSGSFFLNMFLYNVISIPTSFVAIYCINRFGRRTSTMIAFSVAAGGCLAVGIVQQIETDMKDSLTNGFALFASMGISLSWAPVQTMTLELYPTVIRNIGYGSCNTIARLGAVIGPQLAFLVSDTRFNGLMYFVCCGVSVCCILGTFALSETKGEELLDKIEIVIKKSDSAKTPDPNV